LDPEPVEQVEDDVAVDTEDIPIVTPEGGTSWRLSVVAFFVTLAIGLTIGLVWGYNLGARKAAAEFAAAHENAGGSDAPASAPTSGAGQAVLPPAVPPVGVSSTTGRMLVRSTPEGAQVTIDGEPRGETPLDLHNVPFGDYEVRVSRAGFEPVSRRVSLSAKHPIDSETVKLEPEKMARATPAPPPPKPSPDPVAQKASPQQTRPAVPSKQPEANAAAQTKKPAPKPLAPVPALPADSQAAGGVTPAEKPARPSDTTFGSVSFGSRPSGATVFVDGRSVGTTPVRVPSLTPGSHRVRFERNGFHPWATTFVVVAGSEIRVTGSLEPR
jgi:hypothetical protein